MNVEPVILALARCGFLSCVEREFLAKKLDNIESLTVLSIEDICAILRRRIQTRAWNPENLEGLVESDLATMARYGIEAVSVLDARYPPLLRELHDPPFVLFWRGSLPDPEVPVAAIVGTRAPTGSGALAASRIASDFARAGIPVVSGLARGIDAFAHRGCVDAKGRTIAVLACGLDRVYPRSNARLAATIIESGGALVGEYSPGELPLKFRFPQRNRIIAGFARAVVVVEAPEKSGALITADFALEQGRDLFVHAISLLSPRGAGTARLAGEGAETIDSAASILAAWGYPQVSGATRQNGAKVAPLAREPHGIRGVGTQLALEFEKEMDLQGMRDPSRRTVYGLQEGSSKERR